MSTSIDEAIKSLEGIDRENTPPCEIKVWDENGWELCNKPSSVRIKFRCRVCSRSKYMFMCQPHLERRSNIECQGCDNLSLEWKVV